MFVCGYELNLFLQRKRDDSGSDNDAAAQPIKEKKKKKEKKEKREKQADEETPTEPPAAEDTEVSCSPKAQVFPLSF